MLHSLDVTASVRLKHGIIVLDSNVCRLSWCRLSLGCVCFSHFNIARCQQFWVNKEHFGGGKQVNRCLTYTALHSSSPIFWSILPSGQMEQEKNWFPSVAVHILFKKSVFFKKLARAVMWVLNDAATLLERQHGRHIKYEEFASAASVSEHSELIIHSSAVF